MGGSVLARVFRASQDAAPVFTVRIAGNPPPCTRPQVTVQGGFGRAYFKKAYQQWRKAAEKELGTGPEAHAGPLLVAVELVTEQPGKSSLTHPRYDCDNAVKGPLDALSKVEGYWLDDKQVAYLLVRKRWADRGEEPHTIVEAYALNEDTRS